MKPLSMRTWLAWLVAALCCLGSRLHAAPNPASGALPAGVGVTQKLGTQLPLELTFRDADGRSVPLRSYFPGKPVLLVLAYYRCPNLCTLVLNALLTSAQDVPLEAGRDFEIVVVSIDPQETAELAKAKQHSYALRYGRHKEGWHFLTGDASAIAQLADSIGFHYTYDAATAQFAHPGALMVLTPEGRVSRYFAGLEYPPRDLRLALVEASRRKLGSVTDQLFLFCFHYNPLTGKYGLAIMRVLRVACFGAVGLLAGYVGVMLHRERQLLRRVG